MQLRYRYLSSLLLTAVLAAPVAMMAASRPQDDRDDRKEERRESKRYYDRAHKDYHTWDANEDRSYERYRTEHHERRAFIQLNRQQQTVYWKWRHDNPDNR